MVFLYPFLGKIKFSDFIGSNTGQVPPGSNILNATLRVYYSNPSGDPQNVYQVNENWTETNVSWNGFSTPGFPQTGSLVTTFVPQGGTISYINITSVVQNWVNGATNFGILINSTSADGAAYDSSESSTVNNRPKLTVTYS